MSKENFRLPDEMAGKILREATERHTTKTAVVIEALQAYFGETEQVINMAAFLAATEFLALARKQDVGDIRKRLLAEARRAQGVSKFDIYKVGQGQQENHEGTGAGKPFV